MPTLLKDFATSVLAVVEPETTALAVARLMRKHHVGAVVVVDLQQRSRPVGIVTDRDVVLELVSEGLDHSIFTAGDIMSLNPVRASSEMDVMDALRLMGDHRLRRLLIVDDTDQLVGVVTMDDVLKLLAQGLAGLVAGVLSARDREPTKTN